MFEPFPPRRLFSLRCPNFGQDLLRKNTAIKFCFRSSLEGIVFTEGSGPPRRPNALLDFFHYDPRAGPKLTMTSLFSLGFSLHLRGRPSVPPFSRALFCGKDRDAPNRLLIVLLFPKDCAQDVLLSSLPSTLHTMRLS